MLRATMAAEKYAAAASEGDERAIRPAGDVSRG